MKLRHLLPLLAALAAPVSALTTGDIAFTGFNADGTDNLAFVALAPIPNGTIIYFTDEEWNGTGWASNTESQWKWTATSDVPAGTVILLDNLANIYSGTPAASTNLGIIAGITDSSNGPGLAGSDECIFAFLGTGAVNAGGVPIPTTFLAMIANEDAAGAGFSLNGTGLSEAAGTAIIFTSDDDGMRYKGARSGLATFSSYLPLLADRATNWDTIGSGDGTTYVPFSTTAFTVTTSQETLTLVLDPATIAENAGAGACNATVTRSGPTTGALTVNISVSDASEAAAPLTVEIAIGAASADFLIDAVNDTSVDGDQTVTIAVSATGLTGDSEILTVQDDGLDAPVGETLTLVLDPATIVENAGAGACNATVTRSGPTTDALTVNISVSDPSEAAAPLTVEIAIGAASADFLIDAVNDTSVDGDQTVTIAVSATGLTGDSEILTVQDDGLDAPVGALNPGDILFTAYDVDNGTGEGNDQLGFVAMVAIPESTEIYFNENEWNGTAFLDSNEGVVKWTAPVGGLAAGAVVLMQVSLATPTANIGTVVVSSGTINFSGGGDAVYAFLGGSDAPTTFLTALNSGEATATLTNTGLTDGVNAIFSLTTDIDVAQYIGPRTSQATFEGYRAGLLDTANPVNWSQTSPTGEDTVVDTTAFTTGGTPLETLTLVLDPATIVENAGAGACNATVTRSGPTTDALTVDISVSDASEAAAPLTVEIAIGAASADFLIDAVNDTAVDGDQAVTIAVSATGLTGDSEILTVQDDGLDAPVGETLTLVLDPATIVENAGNGACNATVTRSGPTTDALTVNISVSDASEAAAPLTVEIAIGAASADFLIDAVNDTSVDGDQAVTITASATGLTGDSEILTVQDDGLDAPVGALNPGDILFTAFDADNGTGEGNDQLAFVAMVVIPENTEIFFNDNEWTGTAFTPGEGEIKWTAPTGGVSAGSVVVIQTNATPPSANLGTVTPTIGTNISLAGSGESVYAFLGATGAPSTFLTALNSGDTTALLTGTGLTDGVNAIFSLTTDIDVAQYIGPRTGQATLEGYRAGLLDTANPVNWSQTSPTGEDTVVDTTAFTTGGTPLEILTLVLDPATIAENAGNGACNATVTRSGPTTDALTVNISVSDASEAAAPLTVEIAIGAASADFLIDAVNDTLVDGDQAVTVTVSATGLTGDSEILTVQDDGLDTPVGALNPGDILFTAFDADNGTGEGNDQFAFVALVAIPENTEIFFSENEWDGAVMTTGEGEIKWTAPTGGVAAGTVVVVQASVLPPTANVGSVEVSAGTINFSGSGESIYAFQGSSGLPTTFLTALNTGDASALLTNTGLTDGVDAIFSLTASVDVALYIGPRLGEDSFTNYTIYLLDTANASYWSQTTPTGSDTLVDATPFTIGTAETLSLTIVPSTIVENAGAGAATGTVTRTGSTAAALTVTIAVDDESEATANATVEIPIGAASAGFPINAVNDTLQDGDQTVTITVSATGFFSDSATFTVEDDGDLPMAPTGLVLNEIRIDDNGGDGFEYVEIYNPTASSLSLDNLTLLVLGDSPDLDSGNIENATALSTGVVLPPGGYYVLSKQATLPVDIDTDGDQTVDFTCTPNQVAATMNFENSDNVTFLLVYAFTGANGDDLDADDDGTLDTTPWTTLLDAVGMIEEANPPTDTEYAYGDTLGFSDVGPDGTFVPGHIYRSPNGGAWAMGFFGGTQTPDNAVLADVQDTPGLANPAPAGDNYATWATANGISGAAATDDYDNDGLSNLLEYALGFDPSTNEGEAGLIAGQTVTFAKGGDAVANGDVTYQIQINTTPGSSGWVDAPVDNVVENTSSISYTFPNGTSGFARLQVLIP